MLNIKRLCDDKIARFVFESDQAVERHCYIIFGDGGDKRPYAVGYMVFCATGTQEVFQSLQCTPKRVHAEVLNKFTKNLEDISLSPFL